MFYVPKAVVITALISVVGVAACDTEAINAEVERVIAPIEDKANEVFGRVGGIRKPAVVPTNVKANLPAGIPESMVVQNGRGCYGWTIETGSTDIIPVKDEQGRAICGAAS
ncbi:MAG: hypothetical protein GKR99_16270 [Rhodobacteraceae bacterium]|nr:hypothetical protein [Paracoccaceae bacterium]